MRDLLAREPLGRGTDLAGALRFANRVLRRRGIVAVISDFQAEGWERALGVLRRILQAYGTFTVREAEDGRIGLEMVRQRPPDLILLDLMMPEMDGFAVLDALKTDKELSKIPVIVVTAKELTAVEKQRLSGRVQSLMQKGVFSDQDIVAKMVEMLN